MHSTVRHAAPQRATDCSGFFGHGSPGAALAQFAHSLVRRCCKGAVCERVNESCAAGENREFVSETAVKEASGKFAAQ